MQNYYTQINTSIHKYLIKTGNNGLIEEKQITDYENAVLVKQKKVHLLRLMSKNSK